MAKGASIAMSKFNQHVTVSGGRMLGYDEYGPADVVALADRLGIDRFAVLGYSGGGPYAVVCALAIPERLTCVGIVSGAGPFANAHIA
jgi:pimeloyl-ACP methyl ester carboxylesterase